MILFKYIIKEHLFPFFYALFVIIFMMVMDFIIHMIDSILSKGLDPAIIIEIFILNLAWMIALSVPMAVLVASLMAFGRMSSDNEIVALNASGISLYRIVRPAILGSIIICCLLFLFNNYVLPESNHRASMLYRDISRKKPSVMIEEGLVMDDFSGFRIIVDRVDNRSGYMYGIKIFSKSNRQNSGEESYTFAEKGLFEYINSGEVIRFILFNGETHQTGKPEKKQKNHRIRRSSKHKKGVRTVKDGDYYRSRFKSQVLYLNSVDDSFKRSSEKVRGDREMNVAQMLRKVKKYKKAKDAELLTMDEYIPKINLQDSIFLDSNSNTLLSNISVKNNLNVNRSTLKRMQQSEKKKIRKLESYSRKIRSSSVSISKYLVEVHKKYSIPFACIVFVLIGAPLGVMSKSGGGAAGASYSIVFFLLYWISLIGGETLADKMILPPWLAMWSSNIIIGSIGVFLLIRMVKETKYFSWSMLLSKIVFVKKFVKTEVK